MHICIYVCMCMHESDFIPQNGSMWVNHFQNFVPSSV